MNDYSFSLEKFYNPDNRYYPVYSWMWNESVSKEEIKRQLDEMYERNIRGVYVIPMPAEFRPKTMVTDLQPPYLSDGYFEMLSFAADYANKKNMSFWLYDEGGWPSGSVNGLVTKNASSLKLRHIEKGRLKKSSRTDLTSIKATEKFISLTHENHKSKMGKSFCSLGPLVFTDEPTINALPYTRSIIKEYKRRTGKHLSVRKVIKHNDPLFNIIYHDICADVFAKSYFLPIKEWCNSNGLLSAGHLDKDNESYGFRKSFHHPLRQLRLLDVPGVDVINGQIMPGKDSGFFPRLASSAAAQTGSGLSLTESLSVYGNMTCGQMRYVLGYQLVRGINVLNFMLLMYNEKGYYALRQRPTFSKNLPDTEFLPEFNRYIASLQYIMQLGKADTKCALYLPMRSLWAADSDTDSALKEYESTGGEIEKHHGQFDIIDDDLILTCNNEKLKSGIIAMGNAEYTTVYIPADKYMPHEVKQRLEIFRSGGGYICRKDSKVFFPELDISGDNGILRVHKRRYAEGYIYLIFNESPHKTNAVITLPDGTKEFDALNKKIYTAVRDYSFESGEIKIFITGCNALAAELPYSRGNKICHIESFRIRRIKKLTIDNNGISYNNIEDTEQDTVSGGWSALYGEDFSGKCQYRASFTLEGTPRDLILSLGKVSHSCEVSVNGKKAACLFMPPYEAFIDKALLKKENELVITVSGSASNAFVHFKTPAEWEEKHIGPYHEKALEFEKNLLSGGLSDHIEIYEISRGESGNQGSSLIE